MKKIGLGLMSVLFISCAHFDDAPKTVQFPFAAELLKKVQNNTNRAPASFDEEVLSEKSTVAEPQLSFAVNVAAVGMASHSTVISDGKASLKVGFVVSST